jgi:hypothetical protein
MPPAFDLVKDGGALTVRIPLTFRKRGGRKRWPARRRRGAHGQRPVETIDRRAGSAKSVFHFDVQGSVAKSTHAGIPWLRFIRQRLGERAHFWLFDGWIIPAGRSTLVEVYPSLWSRSFAREERNGDQHDAYSAAAWMHRADLDGSLAAFLNPSLDRARGGTDRRVDPRSSVIIINHRDGRPSMTGAVLSERKSAARSIPAGFASPSISSKIAEPSRINNPVKSWPYKFCYWGATENFGRGRVGGGRETGIRHSLAGIRSGTHDHGEGAQITTKRRRNTSKNSPKRRSRKSALGKYVRIE